MSISVVEKSYSSKGHYHTVFVAGFYNVVVPYGAARFGDVLYAASVGSFDIVAEGEEGVAAQGYAGETGDPLRLLLGGESLRDEGVDGVVALGAADVRREG